MTLDELAELIVETCENLDVVGESRANKVRSIRGYLELLAPKNPDLFAAWGPPKKQEPSDTNILKINGLI